MLLCIQHATTPACPRRRFAESCPISVRRRRKTRHITFVEVFGQARSALAPVEVSAVASGGVITGCRWPDSGGEYTGWGGMNC